MKIDAVHHSIPAVQRENGNKAEMQKGHVKEYHASQQSTSHKGVVVDRTKVQAAVNKLNQFNEPDRTNLKFVYHEDLAEYYVTVVDPITNEVIREIPPKKMLDMYVAMTEYMGILVDERI